MAVPWRLDDREHHRRDDPQESPELGKDLAEVVAAAAEDGEDGVAEGSLENAAGEPALGLHVADFKLEGVLIFMRN